MKYTDYSIESILDLNSKQEICKKREIKEEIMKYYNREKYPTLDQLEQISLQLDIKFSTLKAWYRNQRQQERKTPSRPKKLSLPSTSPQERTITPPHPRTTTPPQQRTITHRVSPAVQSPSSFHDGSHHPYFQLINEKIGISPPKTDVRVKTSPKFSPSQQSSPILPYQRFQSQVFPGSHTVSQVLPLYHPFSQPYSQLYYGSPYLQYPVSTPSSLDNIQPLDLSKPVSQSSPENHGIKQSSTPDQLNSQYSPENHGIKQSSTPDQLNSQYSQYSPENHGIKQSSTPDQLNSQSSPENHGIKQSNSPDQLDRIKQHSPNNPGKQSSPNLSKRRHQTSPDHQAKTKTSPEPVDQSTTKIRTKPTRTSKARSTPSPNSSFLLSPPEKSYIFGSGLRQLVIEGRSFSP